MQRLIVLSAFVFPATLSAQRTDTAAVLHPVVVTATRIPTAPSSLSQKVTVLRGDQLRAHGVSTVAEALRRVPGAMVAQSGSFGGVTSLFVRGGESRYTKVLVDGTPINSVGGIQFLENLSLDNVDRIEVVYGPESALYGADAVSGVIQIFTRQGGGPTTLDADVSAGSFAARDATASLRGGSPATAYSLGAGWHTTDGVAAFNNAYRNGDLTGSLQLRPDTLSSIGVTTRYTASVYHFPTDYTGAVNDSNSYSREHRLVVGLNAERQIARGMRVQLLGGDNEIHGLSEDTQQSGIAATPLRKTSAPTDGYRRFAEARLQAALGVLGTATGGIQYQAEQEHSETRTRDYASNPASVTAVVSAVSDDRRLTRGYYVALQGSPSGRVSYDLSARYDNHSDFKSVTTYHVGASVALWSGARIRTSYGTGFNAPAFYQSQGSAYNAPNPSLQPEESHSVDVGLAQSLLNGRVRATVGAFDQRFSSMIQYVAGEYGGPPDYAPVTQAYYSNLTQARSKGYEAELDAALLWGLSGSASYTQTIAQVYSVPPAYTGMQPGDALLRRPSHSATANVTYAQAPGWSAGASVVYVGKRPDTDFALFPSPTVTLPSYVKVGLSGSVRVLSSRGNTASVTARVDNALNRRYEDVLHFPAPGRTILLGVRVTAVR